MYRYLLTYILYIIWIVRILDNVLHLHKAYIANDILQSLELLICVYTTRAFMKTDSRRQEWCLVT